MPITAFLTGSLAYARKALPVKYHIGPKKDILFLIMITGTSLLGANIFTYSTCIERAKPRILELFKKVSKFLKGFLILKIDFSMTKKVTTRISFRTLSCKRRIAIHIK